MTPRCWGRNSIALEYHDDVVVLSFNYGFILIKRGQAELFLRYNSNGSTVYIMTLCYWGRCGIASVGEQQLEYSYVLEYIHPFI